MIFRFTPKLYRLVARHIAEFTQQPETWNQEQILEIEKPNTQIILRLTPVILKNKISFIHCRTHVWMNQTLVSSDFDPAILRKKLR